MLVTSDLHLKPETEDVVFAVLDAMEKHAEKATGAVVVLNGDIFDVRYHVPVHLLLRLHDALQRWVQELGFRVRVNVGNHDQCSVDGRNVLEVLEGAGAVVYSHPGWDDLGLWLPYRKDASALASFVLNNPRPATSPSRAFLHHGVIGAMMNDHRLAGPTDGLPPALFQNFDLVVCGHWHKHQQLGNIVYSGSPYQTKADEANQQKGFLDVHGSTWKFIPLNIGAPRHFKCVFGAQGLLGAEGADLARDTLHVKIPAGFSEDDVAAHLKGQGFQKVFLDPPDTVAPTEQRLDVKEGASLDDYARAYVALKGGTLNHARLLQMLEYVRA